MEGAIEPPTIKPKIPIIGHLIGILWHQSSYLENLRYVSSYSLLSNPYLLTLYSNDLTTPIATLPMVTGKIYLITSPTLAREAFRSSNLAFEPLSIEPGSRIFCFSKDTIDNSTRTDQRCPNAPNATEELNFALHDGLTQSHFQKLILASLNRFSFVINGMGQVTEIESLYGWVRKTMALATSRALFGAEDPLNKDHALVNSLG